MNSCISSETIVRLANLAITRWRDDHKINLSAHISNGRLVVNAVKVCESVEHVGDALVNMHFVLQQIKSAITGVGGWPMPDSTIRDIAHAKPFEETAECEIEIATIDNSRA